MNASLGKGIISSKCCQRKVARTNELAVSAELRAMLPESWCRVGRSRTTTCWTGFETATPVTENRGRYTRQCDGYPPQMRSASNHRQHHLGRARVEHRRGVEVGLSVEMSSDGQTPKECLRACNGNRGLDGWGTGLQRELIGRRPVGEPICGLRFPWRPRTKRSSVLGHV